ncbi:pseudoazurin [Plastorhodobacter daqingensis]|uniref:Pseudoazurin n=1 Tax=Plastorhodobacter daqingensis TaxID=1387281 RepID=A0ABW2UG37_9RHOB
MITRRTHLLMLGGAMAAPILLRPGPARADTLHEVEMRDFDPEDRSQRMVFRPAILEVAPGDSVRFVAASRSHNAQSIDGMIPEGAEPFRGRINEEIEVTFETEGIYGYICQPHQTMGMIGFILVGDFTGNLEQVREAGANLRGRDTTRRFEEYLAEIEAIAEERGFV